MKAFLKNEEESIMIWAKKEEFRNLIEFRNYLKEKYPNMKIVWIRG